MPRPPRCRFIDSYPEYWRFSPVHSDRTDVLVMTLDEFETIRLIDKCGLTQEQCAVRMGVARTTVTAIYDSARKKLADSLVDGTILQIGGGHYRLNKQGADHVKPKGEKTMRIAVTYDNGEVFQHFGHTEFFKFYDVREGRITEEQVVDTNGSGHGALAGFLKEAGTDALICGGIGLILIAPLPVKIIHTFVFVICHLIARIANHPGVDIPLSMRVTGELTRIVRHGDLHALCQSRHGQQRRQHQYGRKHTERSEYGALHFHTLLPWGCVKASPRKTS